MRNEALQEVCTSQIIERCRPHSSSDIEIALGDFYVSFPPGGSDRGCAPVIFAVKSTYTNKKDDPQAMLLAGHLFYRSPKISIWMG